MNMETSMTQICTESIDQHPLTAYALIG